MAHHTKDKGDFAAIKAIADLTQKGFVVLTPVVCEHLPFDIVTYKDGKFLRFQAKYSSNGTAACKTVWNDKNGTHIKKYKSDDFDYYAIYLPDIDKVCYPSIALGGIKIKSEIPNSATPFHWYEDYLDLTDIAVKRTYKNFGVELTGSIPKGTERFAFRKVDRPSKEELEKLVWSKSTKSLAADFGVSDKAIEKWCKVYGITKPPRGYWSQHR